MNITLCDIAEYIAQRGGGGCRTKMLLEKGACVLMPWERFAGRMRLVVANGRRLVVGCCEREEERVKL